jgi:hypothetical protein
MAEVRIISNLSRRTASDSGEQALFIGRKRTGFGDSALLNNACNIQLLLKVKGQMLLVLCVLRDGDGGVIVVVDKGFEESTRFAQWFEKVRS